MSAVKGVGVVGIGLMGLPIARHLHGLVGRVNVVDVAPQRLELASAFGAEICASVAELANQCDRVFVSLPDTATVAAVVGGENGLFSALEPDSVVIETSTITPMQCRELAEQAEQKGIAYLDCPLSGAATGAEAGTLAAMVGGDKEALGEVLPLIEAFTRVVTYLGPSGSGLVTKLTHQITFMSALAGFCEGAVLAQRWGVEPLAVLDAMRHNLAPVNLLEYMEPFLRRFIAGEAAGTMAVPFIDIPDFLELAQTLGVNPLMGSLIHDIFEDAIENGCEGRDDLFALGQAFLGKTG